MKRTEQMNIGGSIFHIDEDAFQMLTQYLKRLKKYFSSNSEGDEVLKDIELRIAELMQAQLTPAKQVITLKDIEQIIEIMGKPEDFMEEEHSEKETHTEYSYEEKPHKRFYRDIDRAVIGGVCSGLSAHFNIDVVFIRILFVVLAFPLFGFTALLYLVLWITMPAAISMAEKASMRGGSYRISDIENTVKEEFDSVKQNFKNYKESADYHNTKRAVNNAGSAFLRVFGGLGRVIMVLIGVALTISGIAMVVGLFGAAIFSESIFFVNGFDLQNFFSTFHSSFIGSNSAWIISAALAILIGAPLIAIIYWGLKLILRFNANDRALSLIGVSLWIVSLITLITFGMFEARDLAFSTRADQSETIKFPAERTLYLTSSESLNNFSEVRVFDEGLDIYSHEDFPNRAYFSPNFKIKQSDSDEVILKIQKEARGKNNQRARKNAGEIVYTWNSKDSLLVIDPLFFQDGKKRWIFSKVKVTLYLPEGQKINIDENLEETISQAYTSDNVWTSDLPGKTWIMTSSGLDYIRE